MNTSSLPIGLGSTPSKKKIGNRERILASSSDLFNQAGGVAITTNHIAKHLGISPGNLYFHFRNKEEIIFELFDQMCRETYAVWKPAKGGSQNPPISPMELIERSYEVFWKYRFFHREMYHLRRKDPKLAKRWKLHISKTMRLLQSMYGQWVKAGVMRQIEDPREMQMISDTVLITSSSFLQFFESLEKPATRRSLRTGLEHLLIFLLPYHTAAYQNAIRQRLQELRPSSQLGH
jgi:AcrR family transcriptional regulator